MGSMGPWRQCMLSSLLERGASENHSYGEEWYQPDGYVVGVEAAR